MVIFVCFVIASSFQAGPLTEMSAELHDARPGSPSKRPEKF